MRKDKISRRDFLKLVITSIGAFLASCMPRTSPKTSPTPTLTSSPPEAITPKPTTPSTSTATSTETSTPTEIPCFQLLAPEDGTKFGTSGRITFEWQSQIGANSYKLLITLPNGTIEEYQTESTQFGKYLESLPLGGEYKWQIVAFDNDLKEICVSEIFLFKKAAFEKPKNDNGSNDNGGDDGGGGQELDPGTQWDV